MFLMILYMFIDSVIIFKALNFKVLEYCKIL